MMVTILAAMTLALLAARWGSHRLALAALGLCLALATGEFLWEIYSPVDGFRLPWLQGMILSGRPA